MFGGLFGEGLLEYRNALFEKGERGCVEFGLVDGK